MDILWGYPFDVQNCLGLGKNTCSNSARIGTTLTDWLSFVRKRCNFACADCIGIHRMGSVENLLKEGKEMGKIREWLKNHKGETVAISIGLSTVIGVVIWGLSTRKRTAH